MVVRVAHDESQAAARKLDVLVSDPSGLVPYSGKWLDYWQRWIDRWSSDPDFRPRERMPLDAARAIIRRAPYYEES